MAAAGTVYEPQKGTPKSDQLDKHRQPFQAWLGTASRYHQYSLTSSPWLAIRPVRQTGIRRLVYGTTGLAR
jgi:hypothetical protein